MGSKAGSVARTLGLGAAMTLLALIALAHRPAQCETITEIIDSTGDGINLLDRPVGVAVDGAGNMYTVGRFSNNA